MSERRSISPWLLAALLVSAPAFLGAQVIVRQGTTADLPYNELKSPMLLDLPLGDLRGPHATDGKTFTDQAKYACDEVVLSVIKVKPKLKDHGALVRLIITTDITVRPSYDRTVDLRFTLVKGHDSVASAELREFKTREQRTTPAETKMEISGETYNKLFEGPEAPVLKVVLAVHANK